LVLAGDLGAEGLTEQLITGPMGPRVQACRDMNLEQVARRAKVSTATVSRVLNNASVVKTSTRARVVKAIEELKYHPNLHARNLAGGKSRTIGDDRLQHGEPFFFDIYKTVESDAHAAGFEVVMANTDYRSEQLVASIRLMIGRRVAGLAAIVSEMEPALIEELTDSAIPVVFYDVGAPRQNITNIRVNYRRGIDKVIDYLHSLGHRKLGFVGHHAMLGPINERVKPCWTRWRAIPAWRCAPPPMPTRWTAAGWPRARCWHRASSPPPSSA
jgi:LacI family transcriptional regulator